MGKHELEFGEPKQTFFRKLKRKIDEIFDDEQNQELTFLGKIFMLGLYGIFVSGSGVVITSIVTTICKIAFECAKLNITTAWFKGVSVLFWLMFSMCFAISISLAVVETLLALANAANYDEEQYSIFTKSKRIRKII